MKRFCCLLFVLLAACTGSGLRTPDKQQRAQETARIQTQLALEYMRIGDYRSAVQTAGEAVANDAESQQAWLVRAQIYQALAMEGEAEGSFRNALKLNPDSAEANNNYGWFLCSRKNLPQQAVSYFDKALADPTYPSPHVAYLNLGICSAKAGRYTAAEDSLARALRIAPDFVPAEKELIRVKLLSGNVQEAREMWQDYSRHGMRDAEDLWLGRQIAEASGDTGAVQEFENRIRVGFPYSEEAKSLKQDSYK
ncbi:MAG: type IV pilus biogenesis/stability protein PilW [Neisseria sp.]|nr:type IV pilus biogenesis/stability protein PilW [Neisseria sp.]